MKRKIDTRVVIFDTADKIVNEMIKIGDRLAHYDNKRWAPCGSAEAMEWREYVKAYKALKKTKRR